MIGGDRTLLNRGDGEKSRGSGQIIPSRIPLFTPFLCVSEVLLLLACSQTVIENRILFDVRRITDITNLEIQE